MPASRLALVPIPATGCGLLLRFTPFSRELRSAITMQVIENMEREMGLEPTTSSLGSWYASENKEQLRPRRCILTTANHRENKRCLKKEENGVNGVKFRRSVLATLRNHSERSSGSPNRAVFNGARGY